MSRVTLISCLSIIICGLFAYDRFITQPKEALVSSKGMLLQMAVKEGWVDVAVALNLPSSGKSSLTRHIDSAFINNGTISAIGRVEFRNDKESFCKNVNFNFRSGSLNDYTIQHLSDCQ